MNEHVEPCEFDPNYERVTFSTAAGEVLKVVIRRRAGATTATPAGTGNAVHSWPAIRLHCLVIVLVFLSVIMAATAAARAWAAVANG